MIKQGIEQLVDVVRLTEWMDHQGVDAGVISNLRPLTGGTQNIVVRFERGGRTFVLRRPPATPYANGNQVMRREARVLKALAGTTVPHPRLLAYCPDEEVLGAAFYLMEMVIGFDPRHLPPLHSGDHRLRERMGYALAEGIAALSRVDYKGAALSDIGSPEAFLDRQVDRWRAQLESYTRYSNWPGPQELHGIERLAEWLKRNQPRSSELGILHGDYHFPNVLYRHEDAELAAIIDWELTTIGDPLIDLGWMLATWPDAEGRSPIMTIAPWTGFPNAAQLIRRYAESSGRDASAADWYTVFACYKLAILLEGSHARAASGQALAEIGQRLHSRALALLGRGLSLIV